MNLFRDNTVFKLTGADEIQNDFRNSGMFYLKFNDRGSIHGHYIKITEDKIILNWNVEGFNRPKEIDTKLEISLNENGDNCLLTLSHKNIKHEEAAKAKEIAWTEILDEMEKILPQ